MTTIVDALLVTLGLDVSGFMRGQRQTAEGFRRTREDADRTARDLNAHGKRAAEFFGQLRNGILGVTAAALGASSLKGLVQQTTATNVSIGNLSRNLQMGVSDLAAWEGAIRRLGGTTEEADGMLKSVNTILQEIKLTGSSAAITPLVRAGLDLGKFRDEATSGIERQLMIADAVKKLSPKDAQSFFAQAGFSEAQINRLMEGRAAIEALIATQRRQGDVTKEMVANSTALARSWQGLREDAGGIANKIVDALTPALTTALEVIREFVGYLGQHIPETTVLTVALSAAIAGFAAIKLGGIIAAIGALTGGLGLAGGAATGLLGIFGRLGLIGGVVGAGAFAVKEVMDLWIAGEELRAAKNRKGVTLTPESQARVDAGETGRPAAAGRSPRGIRNNNPGNLNFVGQAGASREAGAGRFAAFGTMEEGVAALAHQLQLYGSRGIDTVSGIISKFAPPSENNTGAYIKSLAGKLGVSAEDHLDLKNAGVLREMIAGISSVENGPGRLRANQINAGLDLHQSRLGRRSGGASQSETHVGTIVVNTQATDAKGIAKSIGTELKNLSFAQQADYSFN